MKETKTKVKAQLVQTRKAIKRIKQPALRRDFSEMLAGVESSLVSRQKTLAHMCTRALIAMTIGLNKTISPAIAFEILDGLLTDGKDDATLGRAVDLMDTHKDMGCFNSQCLKKMGRTCITIEGARGCANRLGFMFPWMDAIASPS